MLAGLLRALLRPTRRGSPVETGLEPDDLAPDLPGSLDGRLRTALKAIVDGRPRAAAKPLEAAIDENPLSPWPWIVESRRAAAAGNTDGEASALDRAARLDGQAGDDRSAAQHLYARGCLHLRALRTARARLCLEIAHRLRPQACQPLVMLGLADCQAGEPERARARYDQALALASPCERGALRLNRMIDTLPQILDSAGHADHAREEFSRELDALLEDPPTIEDPLAQLHRTAFFLCYQGRNDRLLQERLARLLLAACPALAYRATELRTAPAPGDRVRVGIVSMYLTRHSVGSWYRMLVHRMLESGRFDCTLFSYEGGIDPVLRSRAEARGGHLELSPRLDEARRQIAGRSLDVLLYTDVGMHPFLYFLAFARLAPVQGLLVGHPSTSGIPALDFFISNVFQDDSGAQEHYSERLVRLPSIPVYVEPQAVPAAASSREALGWANDTRTYLCPMMLQKLHPDFDWAIAEILRRDPAGLVVLFSDPARPAWEIRLSRRFEREMPDVADRIAFRPFAPIGEFHALLAHADCVLDPFHFSGGATTYAALALGVPVVTLPGALFRSRMTAGIYAQAGVLDCIARSPREYVELAVALASDPERRRAIGARLRDASARIFDTPEGADALMDWIDEVAGRGR